MTLRSVIKNMFLCFFIIGISACSGMNDTNDDDDDGNDTAPATVNFFNESSYRIDIYKNLNPDYVDPTTLVCSVDDGKTKTVPIYASADQVIGDTFYPRYKVLLADSLQTGTSNIYADTWRDLSNVSFVIENGKTYTKTIPQPSPGQLKFVNGYLKIQNTGSTQVQIIKGDTILNKLDNNAVYLNPGQLGFYEIPFNSFDDTITINNLKAFSSSYVDFPSFSMERGKLYSFTVQGAVVSFIGETSVAIQ